MKCLATELATPDLNSRLEQWIAQRTGGRVHCLRVEQAGERVIVSGHTGSYHVRQLALAAVMEVLDPERLGQMDLEIDVQNGSSKSSLFRALRPSEVETCVVKSTARLNRDDEGTQTEWDLVRFPPHLAESLVQPNQNHDRSAARPCRSPCRGVPIFQGD